MDTDKTKKLKEIATQYGLQLVILFGSQAKGVTHKESDVDIAYAGARPLDIDSEARLIVALAPIFGTDRIDLIDMHRASALILYAITTEGVVLYKDNDLAFPTLRAYAFKRYVEEGSIFRLKKELLQT